MMGVAELRTRTISQRQKEILDYITRFLAEHGREPSYAEISRAVGIQSKAAIAKHIAALEKHGLLKAPSRPIFCSA